MPELAIGKYGRRPASNKRHLNLAAFLAPGELPAHPVAVDNLVPLKNWAMLGNDQAGDCVAVTWANIRRLTTATLAKENYPDQDQVWQVYATQNPDFDPTSHTHGPGSDDDQGMDIQTTLEYLASAGGPDGVKAVAFAKVNHTKPDEVKAAIAIFGCVWTGVTVTAANEAAFDAGKPWDHVAGSPVKGGHSIITGGYLGKAAKDESFITWATETQFTDAFWAHQVDEAWVVVWPEHFGSKTFLKGVDQAALAHDYELLTGRALPRPVPPKPPASQPHDDAWLFSRLHEWSLASHTSKANHAAATDFKAWAKANGFS